MPLCSSFVPTILEGQLCYKLTLNMTSEQGKRNALILLLDYNEDRSLQKSPTEDESSMPSKSMLNFDTAVETIQGAFAKVHINTLSNYVGFGGGLYKMSDVKKMTPKNDFLKMPLNERQCEVEAYEDCRTRKLLEECKCAPWEHPGYQVKTTINMFHLLWNIFCRTSKNAVQQEETALKEILPELSTAVSTARVSMLIFSGQRKGLEMKAALEKGTRKWTSRST